MLTLIQIQLYVHVNFSSDSTFDNSTKDKIEVKSQYNRDSTKVVVIRVRTVETCVW